MKTCSRLISRFLTITRSFAQKRQSFFTVTTEPEDVLVVVDFAIVVKDFNFIFSILLNISGSSHSNLVSKYCSSLSSPFTYAFCRSFVVSSSATTPLHMLTSSPVGYGWSLTGDTLEITWGTQGPAPDSILEFVSCKCRKGCQTKRCSCSKGNLKCTELCQCSNCENSEIDEEELIDSDCDEEDCDDDEFM